jgi:NAD(P)-dependent dehydrogenase (short-subunit alcohol dehydrogenase family)
VKDFKDKIAVVTGGGSGIGRELVLALSTAGCHVAAGDINMAALEETQGLAEAAAPAGTRISLHVCDVSREDQVQSFCAAVRQQHDTAFINLLFSNAGIGGGGSFVTGEREEWDRTFAVCWGGVYNCARAFMPLLVASSEGHIVNVSSVNGFWGSMGQGIAHTAYSAAKFAVKGFSEALVTDLRLNAPHVKVSVVMPGHIGTSIVANSQRAHSGTDALDMDAEQAATMRKLWQSIEPAAAQLSDDDVRQLAHGRHLQFRDQAPTSAAQAATIILDGVKAERWRVLVGDDAVALDKMVRAEPESAYELAFFERMLAEGVFHTIAG